MTTTTATTTTKAQSVTLGTTTYSVEVWNHTWIDELRGGIECSSSMTVLTGPRGAQYHLRPFLNNNGLHQVISFKSGQPLRVRGNEVRVYAIGDVIEVAK